jgi:transcriptional regulator with XRE-family HTH domain
MIRMELSNRISGWRRAKGLSQREVAEAVEVGVPAVSMWESGKTSPTQQNLERLVAFYGLTMAEFYGRVPREAA